MQVCVDVTLPELMAGKWMHEWHDSLNCNVGIMKKLAFTDKAITSWIINKKHNSIYN